MPAPNIYRQLDLSGGIQTATSYLLRKRNEVKSSKNAVYNYKIGSAARRLGYEQVGNTIEQGADGLGAFVYKYGVNNKLITATNNSNNSNTILRYLTSDNYWTDITTTQIAPNTRISQVNHLDQSFIAGASISADEYMSPLNMDSTLTVSTTRNIFNMPKAKYIIEFQGSLYAINCQIGNTKYKDRAYKSSAPIGAITFVQNDQKGLLQQLTVDTVKFLKAGMIVDIYGAGSSSKKIDSLTIISVDKSKNIITFAPISIDLKDNDELWLEDKKGVLSVFWNTDFPTSESSDFLRVPPGKDDNPEFMGVGKSNNRLFLFTRNSTLKWDGANLVTVSEDIGCVSHETIRNIGAWIIWLHTSGVWGYNDSTGQLKLLSRSIQNYIDAIDQSEMPYASAGVLGRVYKVAVGEISELDAELTTSTSTSSTSTSSTSSSTSSTSTSSTSTSSTSSSTSMSSTSVSTTSSSTSSNSS